MIEKTSAKFNFNVEVRPLLGQTVPSQDNSCSARFPKRAPLLRFALSVRRCRDVASVYPDEKRARPGRRPHLALCSGWASVQLASQASALRLSSQITRRIPHPSKNPILNKSHHLNNLLTNSNSSAIILMLCRLGFVALSHPAAPLRPIRQTFSLLPS